jgi:fructoselysine 6-kinase
VKATVAPRLCSVGGAVIDIYQDLGIAFPGGNAPNVAVHAARSGAVAAFLGVVGTDPGGSHIRTSLLEEGVDVTRLRAHPAATPAVTVRRNAAGAYCCVACPVDGLPFLLDDEDGTYLAGFDLIHVAATSRLDALLPAMAGTAPISYDFGTGPDAGAEALLPSVAYATLSRPSFSPDEAVDLCRFIQQQGPTLVLVTRGAAGATACYQRQVHQQPASRAVTTDALGAGDAMIASLAVRLLAGSDLAAAMSAASRYAALACSYLGGFGHGMLAPGETAPMA